MLHHSPKGDALKRLFWQVEVVSKWLQSVWPRTRYDAAPMLALAKAILSAMCNSAVPKILGSVQAESVKATKARDDFAERLHTQNALLSTVSRRMRSTLRHVNTQQSRLQELEEQLRQGTDRYQHAEAEAAALRRAHAVEMGSLAARLIRSNAAFKALQGKHNAMDVRARRTGGTAGHLAPSAAAKWQNTVAEEQGDHCVADDGRDGGDGNKEGEGRQCPNAVHGSEEEHDVAPPSNSGPEHAPQPWEQQHAALQAAEEQVGQLLHEVADLKTSWRREEVHAFIALVCIASARAC
jgi:hypothetical protein